MMRVWVGLLWVLLGVLPAASQGTPQDAVDTALADFNATPGLRFEYTVLGQHPADLSAGGIIYLGMADTTTGEPVEGLLELMVVTEQVGGWQAVLPAMPGFDAAFNTLPPEVRSGIDADDYKPQADPDRTPPSDYGLPFPHRSFGTVTRSFDTHGTGSLDFDLTGRDIAAAKDGTVVYANDSHQTTGPWWYWNTVIIQHGPDEFTLYGHLAPASLPNKLREGCGDDYSTFNCEVDVQRGEAIGAEGNTGRSTDPHLHIEFGQAVNFVALPDIADDDRDGDRTEPVWTGFLYREQNVGFVGYSAAEVAAWPWGRVEQAGHLAQAAIGANIIYNGSFDNGTDGWRPAGQLNWTVQDGALRATRLQTTDPPNFAAFYQFINYSLYAGTSYETRLRLGNASGNPKTAYVELLSAAGGHLGAFGCTFTVPGGAGLAEYIVRGRVSNTWANGLVRVTVNPADGSPALLVDDLSVQRLAEPAPTTACISP